MRPDFGKCVIERPRRGSSNPNKPTRGRVRADLADYEDYDEGHTRRPMHKSMSPHYKNVGDKDFTDVLGPLYGFLRKMVGRPVNDARKEIAAVLGRNKPEPIRHVLTVHFEQEVKPYWLPPYYYSSRERFYQDEKGFLRWGRVVVTFKARKPEVAAQPWVYPRLPAKPPHIIEECELCNGEALKKHNAEMVAARRAAEEGR